MANDMQLFLISPLYLCLLYKKTGRGTSPCSSWDSDELHGKRNNQLKIRLNVTVIWVSVLQFL